VGLIFRISNAVKVYAARSMGIAVPDKFSVPLLQVVKWDLVIAGQHSFLLCVVA
jgi:hypothetical protein